MSMNARFPQRDVTSRGQGPSVHAAGDALEGAYSALLHTAPSGGTCQVIIPALSLTTYYPAICSPVYTGNPGDMVMVVFDENKDPWVIEPQVSAASVWTTGDVKLSALASAPSGWLICNGSAISRTTYAALFTAIGTTYGSGDGSTTFNLPDLRGRVPIGAGTGTASDATNHPLGAEAGTETTTLTDSQMPVHSHGGTTGTDSPDHSHFFSANTGYVSNDHSHAVYATATFGFTPGGTSTSPIAMGGMGGAETGGISANHYHGVSGNTGGASARHAHSISNDGGGTAHTNMQPTTAVNYMIKT